jgi:hypothetical protein
VTHADIHELIQRATSDPSLANQLRNDPRTALRAAGLDLDLASQSPDVSLFDGSDGGTDCVDPPETSHYARR